MARAPARAAPEKQGDQLLDRFGIQRVALFRAVQRDDPDAGVVFGKAEVLQREIGDRGHGQVQSGSGTAG